MEGMGGTERGGAGKNATTAAARQVNEAAPAAGGGRWPGRQGRAGVGRGSFLGLGTHGHVERVLFSDLAFYGGL